MKFLKVGYCLLELCFVVYGALLFSEYRIYLPDYHYIVYTPKNYLKAQQTNQQLIIAEKDQYERGQIKYENLVAKMTGTVRSNLFNYWYGTRWNFNGTSQTPGRGSIACGYFVTTVLQDAGYPIDRVRLACLPSEGMIKELCKKEHIERYSQLTLDQFIQQLPQPKSQLYVIGLDHHTGFITAMNSEWYFVHSSGRFPFCVVKEKVRKSKVLKKSKYRVLGKISEDETFILRWLEGLSKSDSLPN